MHTLKMIVLHPETKLCRLENNRGGAISDALHF